MIRRIQNPLFLRQQAIGNAHFFRDTGHLQLSNLVLVTAQQLGVTNILGLVTQQFVGQRIHISFARAENAIGTFTVRERPSAIDTIAWTADQMALVRGYDIGGIIKVVGAHDAMAQ